MNKLAKLLNKSDEQIFDFFKKTLKQNIYTWDYFVNWTGVLSKISQIETELNILNSLIGAEDIRSKLKDLLITYPNILKVFPILLAIREKSVDVLVDVENFIYKNFNFELSSISEHKAEELADFIIHSGLGEIIKNRKLKNFVDYVFGVEVGIQTNARKNRTGKLMEKIVENFIIKLCASLKAEYLPQATQQTIRKKWDINVEMGRTARKIDFVIYFSEKLFFIETNFYSGGGSKLKATAGEYISMAQFWEQQNIEFIWITDGFGWRSALQPLREYFDKGYFLLNLEMLKQQYLYLILHNYGS